ncbi:MAG: elongation factor P [Clostridia bacterium]|nr:elongation factor P [Clostridia bacterium]MBQ7048375.1 elongation factor P [Clostridia bacterium]
MISAGDFKNGLTFEMDGNVMQVIEFQHVKPGKGAAFVRTKMRNVISGGVVETSFNPTAKFPTAIVERKDMEYSYSDGDLYYFMDMETYDQVPLNADKLPDNFKFVKEGMTCRLVSYKGNVFSVEPPMFVELAVTETEPGFKGNTATNALKPATLETGAEIKVPMFVNEGDVLKIDTRTGEYLERV